MVNDLDFCDAEIIRGGKFDRDRVCRLRANVLAGFPAYTDASVVQARTGNSTALVFGPGRLAQAHSVDEYVPVDHIEKAEAIMARAVNSLCFG